jgi:hypothetical protein
LQRFVDQLVFSDDTVSLDIRGFYQGKLGAHGVPPKGTIMGYTPEGSNVPKVDVESRTLPDEALFTAE